MKQIETKLSCYITQEDDRAYLYVTLIDQKMFTMTLQFSDITNEIADFLEINSHYSLYKTADSLVADVEQAHLNRFMGQPKDNPKLDLIVNLRMKMRHRNGNCGVSCILCNPDIGEDPFPDFTFEINNLEPEDEV